MLTVFRFIVTYIVYILLTIMATSPQTLTGYGPSRSRLYFTGDGDTFPMWETRFINYLYTLDKEIHDAILPRTADTQEGTEAREKNRRAYAELVQVLDERSLQLIMTDCRNDGRAAFKVLREHYQSTEKPRVLTLYEELTTLRMTEEEDITDFVIRAERAATGLRSAGETISDNLVIAMLLKGLPEAYKPFVVVHTQLDKYKTLVEFKAALTNYANTEAVRAPSQASALAASKQSTRPQSQTLQQGQCLSCGKNGHRSRDCRKKTKLSCNYCHKQGHIEQVCFQKKRSSAKAAMDFSFTTTTNGNSTASYKNDQLLVDCGATCHLINKAEHFTTFDKSFEPEKHFIELADGRRSNKLATARGNAKFTILDSTGTPREITLKNALFTPDFPTSLFSVRAATDAGAKVTFEKQGARLTYGNTNFEFVRRGKLYFLPSETTNVSIARTLEDWHISLGHMNYNDINKLQSVATGMTITQSKQNSTCTTCTTNKMTKCPKIQDIPQKCAKEPLDRVHTDICGPINPTSREGYKYVINFIDEASSMLFVYFLRTKDEAYIALKQLIADVAPIGRIKEIHSDNGGEYKSQAFETVLRDNGIRHTMTAPYSPYQNGKSERSWRSLMEMARCLRSDAMIPKSYWMYAVKHAQYLRNRSYQRRTNSTAYELFTGKKPDMRNIHPLGTPCLIYTEGPKQKFQPRGQDGIYLGINPASKSYYVLNRKNNKVTTSRNVRFLEPEPECASIPVRKNHEEGINEQSDIINSQIGENEQETPAIEETTQLNSRPQREAGPPKHLKDYYLSASVDYAYTTVTCIPNTYEEAVHSKDAEKRKVAMDNEINTLMDNKTWELTPLPENRTETKGRWVYTLKQGKEPGKVQYKARYVARGFTQIHGLDYDETFSPTTRFTSIRTLLQKAANDKLQIHQMDVKGAYLNAPIDKDIYIQQPPGYEQQDLSGCRLTCHLRKSLYGLKQSGRNWHNTLTDFLKQKGFEPNKTDPCIYTRTVNNEDIIVLFWVDDILICCKTLPLITETKDLLRDEFQMDDRGPLTWFLGIDFRKLDDGSYTMSQQRYCDAILERFGMSDCNPSNTPAEKDLVLMPRNENEEPPNFPFREAIGSIVYLATATRPDLSFIVSKLSQHLERPTTAHIKALKKVLRYIKGTKSFSLKFTPTDAALKAYTDSDWASDAEDRRSISGFVVTLGSSPISWKSKKQQTVALSSCEAEYMALAEAAKEIIYIRSLCSAMDMHQHSPTTLFCDNQGAIALTSERSKQHQRTKHIDVRYHFVREQKDIIFEYVNTKDNLADIFTKSLGKMQHRHILEGLQIEGAC